MIGAAAILVGGGLWWWASGESGVDVPDRICGGALSGKAAAEALPKQGAQYKERSDNTFGKEKQVPNVWCRTSAGGQSLLFSYWWSVSDLSSLAVENPGHTPIRLGTANGYTSGTDAELYLSCRGRSDTGAWLKVRLARGATGAPDTSGDGQDPAHLAELVGDAARYVGKELACEGAAGLPGEPPAIGTGSPRALAPSVRG
ncbi:hypothetical protein ABZ729_06965 [Streptomyces sp. NPDC006678]|uniref:hypothetical protein n=1 Tax=Streptomyces sp. NPDC006678 TaxID=3157185 RepID=UPI0033E30075